MATLKEVAKRAGVSTATVSYVLNNTGVVSNDTKERVLAVVREMEYNPNILARNLRRQESNLIGLVVSNMDSDFYSSVASTMEDLLYQRGYSILICNSNRNPEKEKHYYNMMLSKMLSGMVIAPVVGKNSIIYRASRKGLPIVVINRRYTEHTGTTITIDDYGKARECVLHLAKNHHYKEIAVIKNQEGIQNEDERFRGYTEALDELHMEKEVYVNSDYPNGVFDIVGNWVDMGRIPRSCFITETRIYINLLAALRLHQINCPEDIALIGFCDSKLSGFFQPPISAVRNPGDKVAKVAVEELLKLLNGAPPQKKQMIVNIDIDYRSSCGCIYQY